MGTRSRIHAAFVASGLGVMVGQACLAQDGDWLPGDGMPGTNDVVRAITSWDDGAGPDLYIGGDFTFAVETFASHIARWDGMTWTPVAEGLNGDVYVLGGDGSYLMLAQEIVTSIQEGVRLTVVLFDNQGFASIGGLSESVGCSGFLTRYRRRDNRSGLLEGDVIAVDFAANAESLGARTIRACTPDAVKAALESARGADRTTVIVVPVDPEQRVPGYEAWWDVPVAEVSTIDAVQSARAEYERARKAERHHL